MPLLLKSEGMEGSNEGLWILSHCTSLDKGPRLLYRQNIYTTFAELSKKASGEIAQLVRASDS